MEVAFDDVALKDVQLIYSVHENIIQIHSLKGHYN